MKILLKSDEIIFNIFNITKGNENNFAIVALHLCDESCILPFFVCIRRQYKYFSWPKHPKKGPAEIPPTFS